MLRTYVFLAVIKYSILSQIELIAFIHRCMWSKRPSFPFSFHNFECLQNGLFPQSILSTWKTFRISPHKTLTVEFEYTYERIYLKTYQKSYLFCVTTASPQVLYSQKNDLLLRSNARFHNIAHDYFIDTNRRVGKCKRPLFQSIILFFQ